MCAYKQDIPSPVIHYVARENKRREKEGGMFFSTHTHLAFACVYHAGAHSGTAGVTSNAASTDTQ